MERSVKFAQLGSARLTNGYDPAHFVISQVTVVFSFWMENVFEVMRRFTPEIDGKTANEHCKSYVERVQKRAKDVFSKHQKEMR